MTGEEKFATCEYRSTHPKKVFIGCPCKKKTKDVYSCSERKLAEVLPSTCESCELYKKLDSNQN